MDFSKALSKVKEGKKIARKGWNGNGMYIYFVSEDSYESKTKHAKKEFGDVTPYLPYLALKTVNDKVVPWTVSQTDILSDDWTVLE